jgi:hypothetical protein
MSRTRTEKGAAHVPQQQRDSSRSPADRLRGPRPRWDHRLGLPDLAFVAAPLIWTVALIALGVVLISVIAVRGEDAKRHSEM